MVSARFNDLCWAPLGESVGLSWVHLCIHTLTRNSVVRWEWLGNLSSMPRVSHPPSGASSSVTRRTSLWWKQKHKRKPAQFCLEHLQISYTRKNSKMVPNDVHLMYSCPCEISCPGNRQDLLPTRRMQQRWWTFMTRLHKTVVSVFPSDFLYCLLGLNTLIKWPTW